jgi:hypothetical protein
MIWNVNSFEKKFVRVVGNGDGISFLGRSLIG